MSVSIDGTGSLIGVDQGLNIVGLTTLTGGIILDDSISHIGDTDTKIRFPAADTFTVETAGSERLRIASDGNITLGYAGNSLYFQNGFNNRASRIQNGGGSGSADLKFYTNNAGTEAERLRITSTGKIGIGHQQEGQITKELTIRPANDGGIRFVRPGASGASVMSHLELTTTTSGSVYPSGEAYTVKYNTVNNDQIFTTYAGGGTGGNISFQTGTGSGNEAERLRINYAGKITVTPADTTSSYATTDGGIDIAQVISSTGTSASQSIGIQFSLTKSGQTGAIAEIGAIREGSGLSGLVFRTRDNSTGRNERLRIDSNGRIGTNGRAPSDYNNPDLLISGDNATLTIMGDGSNNNSSIAAIKFRVAGASTGDYTKAGIFVQRQDSYNDLDMIFAFRSSNDAAGVTLSDEKLRIDSDGRMGLGTNSPNSYDGEADNFVVASSDHTGITIASTGSNKRTNLYFADGTSGDARYRGAFTYDHNDDSMMVRTAGTEKFRIFNDGRIETNGVRNIYETFRLANNQTYNWDYTVPDEGGYGNSFYLVAGYNHYYTGAYGAHRTVWFSARGTNVNAMGNGIEQYHSQSGSWTFSKPNATTVRITKTNGTYGGQGYGFFHLMYNHF